MGQCSLDHIRLVLVEPAGPRNVGAIARVMKNMGLRQLVLVNPQCDPLGDEARQMAVHAADVLERAQRVVTLPEALAGCQRAVATTGRDTTLSIALESPKAVLPWLLDYGQDNPDDPDASPPPAALILGREDRGLTNEELNYAQRLIRIPTSDDYSSLNLAQAAGLCCYELHLAAQESGDRPPPMTTIASVAAPPSNTAPPTTTELAPLEHLERFYRDLEALLLTVGYLYPHTAASRMEKLRRLLHRAYPTAQDVAMLHGILSQTNWALTQASPKPSSPIEEVGSE
ncbi:MAG TPA: RNA methyltransferase [Chroococcidiopsis sp.]